MTIVRCNKCGNTLKQVYYNDYKKTEKGYSRSFPQHLANLYYCDKENVAYQRQERGFIPVLDLNDETAKKVLPQLEELK